MKILFPLYLPTGLRALFSKICQLMKWLNHVPNIILGAVDDDCDYDEDDNQNGDANSDYDKDHEC